MRGLDPRIHLKKGFFKKMDWRVKPGNDTPDGDPPYACPALLDSMPRSMPIFCSAR